jgi:hypothetical protein
LRSDEYINPAAGKAAAGIPVRGSVQRPAILSAREADFLDFGTLLWAWAAVPQTVDCGTRRFVG